MSWDKTFCHKSDATLEKCRKCEYYLDKRAYKALCDARGYAVLLSVYMTPPCEAKAKKKETCK